MNWPQLVPHIPGAAAANPKIRVCNVIEWACARGKFEADYNMNDDGEWSAMIKTMRPNLTWREEWGTGPDLETAVYRAACRECGVVP